MPSLALPSCAEVAAKTDNNSDEWVDSDKPSPEDDGLTLRKMSVVMDISDLPPKDVLKRRVSELFNRVFELEPALQDTDICEVCRLSGAMTNCVFMVEINPGTRQRQDQRQDQRPMPRKYLLRVYGAGVDEFLSREKELYWLSQLTALGFGPRLYGIFGNGRLEEFLESTTLTRDDMRKPVTSKHIARRLCELHSLVSYYRPYGSEKEAETPELWSNIDSWMALVQRKWGRVREVCQGSAECQKILDNWGGVERVARELRQKTDNTSSPIVFAHDDLQYGNILRLRTTGELVVVDFEYAGYNYRGFDIANHFCEWMADYHHPTHPHALDPQQYPSQHEREAFLRTYVKAKAFMDANMRADVGVVESDTERIELRAIRLSDETIRQEVRALDEEVQAFVAASHLHWGVWGLLQACSSEIDFDYVGYASRRLGFIIN